VGDSEDNKAAISISQSSPYVTQIFVSFGLISFIIIFGLLSCVELDTS
jgi:hypothetical protein